MAAVEKQRQSVSSERYDLLKEWNSGNVCVVFLINKDLYSQPTWVPRNWMPEVRIPITETSFVQSIDYDRPEPQKYLLYRFNGRTHDGVSDKLIYNCHTPREWEYPVLELDLSSSRI